MSEFQVTARCPTRAIIIFPNISNSKERLSPESRLLEAVGLAHAISIEVVFSGIINLKEVKSGKFFGQGQIGELRQIKEEQKADLLIVDASLSPIQQRNLEKELEIKVIDRTALILEIFGERAHTKEGKLQVELAHLIYQRSRLVRSWTHLERQRGGAGFLGGPGETQIELDRRIIDDKIVRIKKELEKVKKTRELQRSTRKKVPYPVVALVGYTNAGKSSLFNYLTQASVFAQDLLFATLDPTMRKLRLPSGKEIILSDTVGFISDLPHELIMSFRATLEEVLEASIVVHVRDIANSDTQIEKQDVLEVLSSLGLKHIEDSDKYVELLNKKDLLSDTDKEYIDNLCQKHASMIATSAITGEGIREFLDCIDIKLAQTESVEKISIGIEQGKLISWLHEHSEILSEKYKEDRADFEIRISKVNLSKLQNQIKKQKI